MPEKVYCRDCRFCGRLEGFAWKGWCRKRRYQVFLSKAAMFNSCSEGVREETGVEADCRESLSVTV